MIPERQSLEINTLLQGYREQRFTPRDVIAGIVQRIDRQPNHNAWVTRLTDDQLDLYISAIAKKSPDELPLYGIPFAIKDNIDLAGVPTTAGCAEYAYRPERSAFVVEQLIAAGAIPVGKTNLDQFATGLTGTRSPYGPGKNSFNPDYISGGSSSGSAIAVAMGQASFSLGTDTAGSGRVPAAFNNLVGIKPTKGLLSTTGVVPACRSLDCVSVFALTCGDAERVLEVAAAFDAGDVYARQTPSVAPLFSSRQFTFGIPRDDQLQFFGNAESEQLFRASIGKLESLGGRAVRIDFAPFLDAARLLYEGPWVTERYVAIETFINEQPDALLPVTRKIISGGATPSAADGFKAQYRLAECKRRADALWKELDVLITPTAGTLYRIDEINADPLGLNSNLGFYTNFMNLLDLSAIAVPAGFQADGLPFGVTLIGPPFADPCLLALADRLHGNQSLSMGATDQAVPRTSCRKRYTPAGTLPIAVCGAHLSGLPLNHQLTERGAILIEETSTSENYHLYALGGGPPYRPGLIRGENGNSVVVEVWALPLQEVGSFLETIPAPLGLGSVELVDGRRVFGFICEISGIEGAQNITALGSWRMYIENRE